MLRALTADEVVLKNQVSTPSTHEVVTRLSANIADDQRRHMARRIGAPAPDPLPGAGHLLPQHWVAEVMV
jgi:hypothetical protein